MAEKLPAKPPKCSPSRPRPHAVCLLGYYGLTPTHVARACGTYLQQVQIALDTKRFVRAEYANVVTIRSGTERLLREAGWQGEPAELWAEYDAALRERSAA